MDASPLRDGRNPAIRVIKQCVGRDGAIRPALVVLRTVLALSGRDR